MPLGMVFAETCSHIYTPCSVHRLLLHAIIIFTVYIATDFISCWCLVYQHLATLQLMYDTVPLLCMLLIVYTSHLCMCMVPAAACPTLFLLCMQVICCCDCHQIILSTLKCQKELDDVLAHDVTYPDHPLLT